MAPAVQLQVTLTGTAKDGRKFHASPAAKVLGNMWKALLPPVEAGGNFSITVACV